jgi:demethylmenaquinone methyltransferase/2-methoxy-6-polyprenyl-1,4-benzoquinol methylase
MLTECQTSCGAPLVQAVGECLPFADNTFDVISFGYGLRHVEDLRQLFTDFFRVLSPGGRVVILEICVPRSLLARWCYRIYLGSILPKIVELGPGRKEARLLMEYFWDTIHNCVPPETILEELRKTGFGKSEHRVSFGGLGEYIATRSDEI